MIIDGKKYVVLYLTGWQMRMVEDVLGLPHCRVWYVPVGNHPVIRYMGPQDKGSGAKRMYLTEWQRREIKDEADEDCLYVELGGPGTCRSTTVLSDSSQRHQDPMK